jgi:hypothetical protein
MGTAMRVFARAGLASGADFFLQFPRHGPWQGRRRRPLARSCSGPTELFATETQRHRGDIFFFVLSLQSQPAPLLPSQNLLWARPYSSLLDLAPKERQSLAQGAPPWASLLCVFVVRSVPSDQNL